MRVAYVCADPGIPVFGSKGASVHVREMLRALVRRGAAIDLFATHLGGTMPEGLGGRVRVHAFPLDPASGVERELAATSAAEAIGRRIAEDGPFDLLYERYSLWSSSALEAATRLGLPSVLEVNAPLIDEQERHRTLFDRERALAVADVAFRSASVIAAVSEGVASWVRKVTPTVGGLHVVPNGVDPDRFSGAAPAADRSSDEFVVGFVGTLKPWHGLDSLVDAFARLVLELSGARLLVVGDGPERAHMVERLAAASAAPRATFTGAIDPDAIPAYLASMDAAVAPYPRLPDFYFSPLKVFEYMAAGLPIVASRIGQVEEILDDECALLTQPGSAEALGDALIRLGRDAGLRRRLGEAARARVGGHTWDGVLDRVLDLASRRVVGAA